MKNPIKENVFNLRCACGDGNFVIEYFGDGQELFLDYNISAFYAYQKSWWDGFKKSLSIILKIILGKEYTLYETVLDTKSEVDAFKSFVADIDTSKLVYDE